MPNKIITTFVITVAAYCIASPGYADMESVDLYHNRFYVGLTGGYGSTTWGQLVPQNENAAMSLSTPTSVSEGGFIWGLVGGYEFLPQFALEATYMYYPEAKLYFDPMSLFTYDYDGRTQLTTRIETISFMPKIMLVIPRTKVRVFSSFGAAVAHRFDAIKNIWHVTPTFGAGLNYAVTDHWMGEIGVNYVAGYGKVELDPTKDYVPFLYSVFVHIAYRF